MAKYKKFKGHSGEVNFSSGNVNAGGDIVGGNKTTRSYNSDTGASSQLDKEFAKIKKKIKRRADDPDVDKTELRNLVENIEQEVKKGETANTKKVERWLKFLAEMADDIFQVTAATLVHPVVGVTKTIQLIAQKATEQTN
jgi:hypothetical protein